MTDTVTITIRLDKPVYDRLKRKKEAAGMNWQGVLKQTDLSHIRTPDYPEPGGGKA